MKKSPLLILSVLLAACGPDKLISDCGFHAIRTLSPR